KKSPSLDGVFWLSSPPVKPSSEGMTKMFSGARPAIHENILVMREHDGGQVNLLRGRRPAALSNKEGKPLIFVGVQPA
ncbi:hypothetical protein ACUNXA_004490, partial [Salmonella enterica subsp. enterica serovar Bareilly]